MTQDWNWFFSSLSQSAAAIVGIFGAFIITKIFSNQSSFLEKSTKLKQAIIHAKKISDDANSHKITWYNKHYNYSEFVKFHEYLDAEFPKNESIGEVTDQILESFIASHDFSVFSEKEEVKKELIFIAEKVIEENTFTREEEEAASKGRNRYSPLSGFLGYPDLVSTQSYDLLLNPKSRTIYSSHGQVYDSPWKELNKEREGLKKNYLEAKHHARLVTDLLESTEGNPESPGQISAALVLVLFIFFIGVIYPLSFMPASSAPEISLSIDVILSHILSFKGALLGIISAAFSIIVAIFYISNYRMKYSQDSLIEIRGLTDTKNYCTYFKFIEASNFI